MTKNSCYAIYHGDNFVDLGSKSYLAKKLNIKKETISYYATSAHRKRTNDNSWIVIKIEGDDVC